MERLKNNLDIEQKEKHEETLYFLKSLVIILIIILAILILSKVAFSLDEVIYKGLLQEQQRYTINQINNHTDYKLTEGEKWLIEYKDQALNDFKGVLRGYFIAGAFILIGAFIASHFLGLLFDMTFIHRQEAIYKKSLKDLYELKENKYISDQQIFEELGYFEIALREMGKTINQHFSKKVEEKKDFDMDAIFKKGD